MYGLVHESYNIRSVARLDAIDAADVLANVPDRVVGETERDANCHMAGDAVRNERDGLAQMVIAQFVEQLVYAQAHLTD